MRWRSIHNGASRNAQNEKPSRTKTTRSGSGSPASAFGGGSCTVQIDMAFTSLPLRAGAMSAAGRSFGRRHLVDRARIDRHRRAQRPCQTFEAGFGNMMVVAAEEGGDMQRHAAVHREGLEPLLHQL